MNRSVFFDDVRRSVFGGKLSQTQVDGLTRILDYRDAKYPNMPWWECCYLLAITTHETGHRMQPVREMGGEKYLRSKPYYPWVGEGLAQVTWESNHRKFGGTKPGQLLTWEKALPAIFRGMIFGMFTGKKLADYHSGTAESFDAMGARSIIQGKKRKTDRYAAQAKEVATHYYAYKNAWITAENATPEEIADAPDNPTTGTPVSKSTTVGGAIVGGASGTIAAGKEIIESAKQATEVGKSAWDIAAQVGPWVVVALVIIAATCYIIYERRRHAKENGI